MLVEQSQAVMNQVTQYAQLTSLLTYSASPAMLHAQPQLGPAARAPAATSVPERESYATDPASSAAKLQFLMVFSQRALTFATDIMKRRYVLGMLQGRALA